MSTTDPSPSAGVDLDLREQLSNLQGLLMLSMLMTQCDSSEDILRLAETSVAAFGSFEVVSTSLDGRWVPSSASELPAEVQDEVSEQVSALASGGGAVEVPGFSWARALPLRSLKRHLGFMVVANVEEPTPDAQFLLQMLAQQTGVALVNAGLHATERLVSERLRRTNESHVRLTQVAAAGEGQDGIARALHELTGLPVAVEDRYGNLRAWAGPDRPDPYPKDSQVHREDLLRRARRNAGPVREGDRLVAIAGPAVDVLGVVALIDPEGRAGDCELVAMEHGATVLGMELARVRSLAETELRLRRDLVDELLSGTDEASAVERAHALGHDLEKRHRVVVVEGQAAVQDLDAFLSAVRRVARQVHPRSLVATRGQQVVLLSENSGDWEEFRERILADLGGGRCRIGVGDPTHRPSDFPRSYREAQLALRMQQVTGVDDRAIAYADLGVYRILADVEHPDDLQRFIGEWLGDLLEYDERKGADLVLTLSRYLEAGGSYQAAATAMSIHRSTLKYRLQRIRDISGHDLSDPTTAFNLQLATRTWQTVRMLQA